MDVCLYVCTDRSCYKCWLDVCVCVAIHMQKLKNYNDSIMTIWLMYSTKWTIQPKTVEWNFMVEKQFLTSHKTIFFPQKGMAHWFVVREYQLVLIGISWSDMYVPRCANEEGGMQHKVSLEGKWVIIHGKDCARVMKSTNFKHPIHQRRSQRTVNLYISNKVHSFPHDTK